MFGNLPKGPLRSTALDRITIQFGDWLTLKVFERDVLALTRSLSITQLDDHSL